MSDEVSIAPLVLQPWYQNPASVVKVATVLIFLLNQLGFHLEPGAETQVESYITAAGVLLGGGYTLYLHWREKHKIIAQANVAVNEANNVAVQAVQVANTVIEEKK